MCVENERKGENKKRMDVDEKKTEIDDVVVTSTKTRENIVFTPLYGVEGYDPLCYLLEFEGIRILLDCGWTDELNVDMLKPLKEVAAGIDAVFLSFPDVAHAGALAYAFSHFNLDAPVYATIPTAQLGRAVLEDFYASVRNRSSHHRTVFDMAFVDFAFSRVVRGGVNFLERAEVRSRSNRRINPLNCVAYSAGRMVGGSIWKIFNERDKVVYAVDHNVERDYHMGESALCQVVKSDIDRQRDPDAQFIVDTLIRPTLLIAGANNASRIETSKFKTRVSAFKRDVRAALLNGGNVLVPVDAGGRVLEILLVLHRMWLDEALPYSLGFVHHRASMTMDYARRSLEWMHPEIRDRFNATRENVFDIATDPTNPRRINRALHVLSSSADLGRFLAANRGPKVICATSESLESGFARDLFKRWAGSERNLVCFVSRAFAEHSTLARTLQRSDSVRIDVGTFMTVPLRNDALKSYRAERARLSALKIAQEDVRKKERAIEEAQDEEDNARRRDAAGDMSESDEEANQEEEEEEDWRDSFVESLADRSLVAATSKGTQQPLMFDFRPPKIQMDEYGAPHGIEERAAPTIEAALKKVESSKPTVTPEGMRIVTAAELMGTISRPVPDSLSLASATMMVGTTSSADEHHPEDETNPTGSQRIAFILDTRCRVATHDLEGRSNGVSMRIVVKKLMPRHVIFVHGNREERKLMLQYVAENLRDARRWSPAANERVRIASESHLLRVMVDETVLRGLTRFEIGQTYQNGDAEYSVASLRAVVSRPKVDESSLVNTPIETVDLALTPEVVDHSKVGDSIHIAPSVFVRRKPLTLRHLRKVIKDRTGMRSTLQNGKLYVKDTVVVHSINNGDRFKIEGVVGNDYFAVRSIVYAQYAIL